MFPLKLFHCNKLKICKQYMYIYWMFYSYFLTHLLGSTAVKFSV